MRNEITKMELLKQISSTRFMLTDLGLFLNTHPMDKETVVEYNYYVMQWRGLKEKYEMDYGMLTEHDSLSPYPWQWIDEPWPWENEANFMFEKGDV
jgi:spore coat protein JB